MCQQWLCTATFMLLEAFDMYKRHEPLFSMSHGNPVRFFFFAFSAACCSKSTASEARAIIKLAFTHLFLNEFSHFPSLGACCSALARAVS